MDPALVVWIVIFALGLLGLYFRRKTTTKAKKLGAKEFSVAVHMHGVPGVSQHSLANLFFTDEKIIIEANKNFFELNYSQVTAAEGMRKSDLLVKDKSVIARGAVGGILLGPVGAIVGGISGIGQKKIKGDFLILNYLSSGESEPKVIIFDVKNISKAMKLAKFIKSKLPVSAGQTVNL